MKPEYLVISGWGPYKDKVEIDFTQFGNHGLFLITGPTGAGKTTIFDAISYALFGEVSGNMRTKDGVRSDFADADTKTYVTLTLSHGEKTYQIERNPQYYRPKKRKTGGNTLTKENENAVLHLPEGSVLEGNREVNAKIQDILGMDFEQFKQLSMIAQGEFARLLTANSKEKTQIFRKIFNTHKYERFAMNLNQKSKELYAKIMTYHNKMDEAIDSIRPILLSYTDEEKAAEMEDVVKQYELLQEWIAEVLTKRKEALQTTSEEVKKSEKELLNCEKKIQEAVSINKLFAEYREAVKEQERLEHQAAEIQQEKCILEQARNAEKLQGVYVQREEAGKQLENLKNKIVGLQKDIELLVQKQEEYHLQFEKKEELKAYLELIENYVNLSGQYHDRETVYKRKEQELELQQKKYLELELKVKTYKQQYENMEEQVRHAMVGIVAKEVREGEPCPVCGSMEHPKIAEIADTVPREEDVQEYKEQYETKNALLMDMHGKTSTLHGAVQTEKQELLKRKEELREKQEKLMTISDIILQLLLELGMKECQNKHSFTISLQENGFQQKDCKRALERLESHCEQMQQFMAERSAKDTMLSEITEEEKEQQKKVEKYKESFKMALEKAGFIVEAQYQNARKNLKEMEQLQKKITSYAEKKVSHNDYVRRMEKSLKGKQEIPIETLKAYKKEVEMNKKKSLAQQNKIQIECAQLKTASDSIQSKRKESVDLEQKYGMIKDLDNITMGNNGKRLVFEQYVLISYFEDVLHAANSRLQKMTAGRYLLSRVENVSDGRTKDNFELQVLDNYTGKYRLAKTLSGGESFKASLSLALGMSDIIQASCGGVRVETLFIDEGFGSLDSESLEMACETLLSLVDKERFIGIISHVAELQERIPRQLIVSKTHAGSSVKVQI